MTTMGQEKGFDLTSSPSTIPRTRRSLRRCLVVIIAGLLILAYHLLFDVAVEWPANTRIYPDEKISWTPCGEIDDRRLECSRVDVPMDHFNTSTSKDKTFNLAIIRLRGDDNAKNIWLNPGGPGASGIDFIRNRGKQFSDILGRGYHLLSVASRGIGDSRPQALCYPDKDVRSSLAISPFQPIDRSAEAYAWASEFARACEETTGEHGYYINTPQTATDMNAVLDAVGQHEMIYWGFSYGTILGQTYASMYPDRVHRMIIDGVADLTVWYEDRIAIWEAFKDTERVMYGFFDECIKAEDCPLAKFANTTDELQRKVLDFASQLIEEPLSVYINNSSWGVLKYEEVIFTGIFAALYSPSTWWDLAVRLAKLLDGDATEAFLSWAGKGPLANLFSTDQSYEFISKNDAPTGIKNWPEHRQDMLKAILPSLKMNLFAPATHLDFYIRRHWAIPKKNPFKPPKHVKTAHPLLIVNTKWDPICPLASAKSARDMFEGSQIVEIDGYGHCSFNAPSSCAARYVRDYLDQGTIPKRPVECSIDGRFFQKPAETHDTLVR